MANLTIIEEQKGSATVWNVTENGIVIATFDSRGGYTRADAEKVINDDEESEEEKQMSRAEMFL